MQPFSPTITIRENQEEAPAQIAHNSAHDNREATNRSSEIAHPDRATLIVIVDPRFSHNLFLNTQTIGPSLPTENLLYSVRIVAPFPET